jgi:hypothetical protein
MNAYKSILVTTGGLRVIVGGLNSKLPSEMLLCCNTKQKKKFAAKVKLQIISMIGIDFRRKNQLYIEDSTTVSETVCISSPPQCGTKQVQTIQL